MGPPYHDISHLTWVAERGRYHVWPGGGGVEGLVYEVILEICSGVLHARERELLDGVMEQENLQFFDLQWSKNLLF